MFDLESYTLRAQITVGRFVAEFESGRKRAVDLGHTLSEMVDADWTDFALIALMFVYISVGPFQHFPPPGWVDPGIYMGYFRNLPGLMERYGPSYFANRWPLVLLGQWLYATFPLKLADAALIAVWYGSTLLALRALLKPALAPVPRKITLVLYGCSPLVIATVTRTYADGPAIAFLLLALAAIFVGPGKLPSNARLFVSGACAVFALLTQPVSFLALGPMLAGLMVVNRRQLAQLTPMAFVATGCGIAIAAHVYMAVAFKVTGWSLLGPLLDAGQKALGGIGLLYRQPLFDWVFYSTRVFFVALTIAAGLWTAASRKTDTAPPGLARLFHWALISACGSAGIIIVMDVGMRTSFLQFPFCASYLLPSSYILLGSIVAIWTGDLTTRDQMVALAAALGFSTVGCLALLSATVKVEPASILFPLVVLICSVGAVFIVRNGPKLHSVLPAVGLLAALWPLASISADTREVFRGSAPSYGTTYMVLKSAADVIDATASKRTILFWFDRAGFNSAVGSHLDWSIPHNQIYPLPFKGRLINLNALDSLNAYYLWYRSQLNDVLPNLSPADLSLLRTFPRDLSIVVVSYRGADIALARTALGAAGFRLAEHDDTLIRSRALTLHLAIFDLDRDQAAAKH